MKAIKYLGCFLLAIVFLLTVSGCGNTKVLECESDQSLYGMTSNQKVAFNFKNDKINSMKMSVGMNLPEEIKESWDVTIKTFDEQFKSVAAEGIEVTTSNNKKDLYYSVVIDIDLNKVSKENLETLSLGSSVDDDYQNLTIEEAQEGMEKSGYACKVK